MAHRVSTGRFVPVHKGPTKEEVSRLGALVSSAAGRLLVITGAGVSTESGIPDYRSEKVGRYSTSKTRPMTYQEFLRSPAGRQRYWARSFVGYPQLAALQPNTAHRTLVEWEARGLLSALVTQNVDCLHSAAGQQRVAELHGRLHRVRCLQPHCRATFDRAEIQKRIEDGNPDWTPRSRALAPDGDVDLSMEEIAAFFPPTCPECSGDLLQPDVVFFGDNVPPALKAEVEEWVDEADAVLAIGTSLQTFSAYRILLRASEQGKRIGIVNIGPTRADALAQLKVDTRASAILPLISEL